MVERIDVERAVKETADLARLSAGRAPVALAMLRRSDASDVDRRRLEREVEVALREMRTVFNIVSRHRLAVVPKRKPVSAVTTGARPSGPEASSPAVQDDPDDMWCKSCLRVGHFAPRATGRYAQLCRWCGDFQAVQGQLPPEGLLDAHHRGVRLTSKAVALALKRPPARRKKSW